MIIPESLSCDHEVFQQLIIHYQDSPLHVTIANLTLRCVECYQYQWHMKCNNILLTQDMQGDMLIRHIILCMLASDPRGWVQLRLYGGLLARCNGG